MLTMFVTAEMLAQTLLRTAFVTFAGVVYEIDHVSTLGTGVTYLELTPAAIYANRRTVHIQLHRNTPMEVHIPLM